MGQQGDDIMTSETDNGDTLVYGSQLMQGRSGDRMDDVTLSEAANCRIEGFMPRTGIYHRVHEDASYNGELYEVSDIERLDYYHGATWGERGIFQRVSVPMNHRVHGADEAELYLYTDMIRKTDEETIARIECIVSSPHGEPVDTSNREASPNYVSTGYESGSANSNTSPIDPERIMRELSSNDNT